MSNFQVGDEVVCINDGAPRPPLVFKPGPSVTMGRHYKVSAVGLWGFTSGCWVMLSEFGGDFRYDAERFRKVRPDAIELFRQMCASQKPLVPVGTMV